MGFVLAVAGVSARQGVGCAPLKGQFQLRLKCQKRGAELFLGFRSVVVGVSFKSQDHRGRGVRGSGEAETVLKAHTYAVNCADFSGWKLRVPD
ncbi:MAG: hypothetical protein Ct9H300mP14_15400 [Gammaproteobacteria bacterium]|nr:MAG: hypothetical protein Ct9H300mP14_15400 [Gammaproteobacteria bacterium]